LFQVKVCRLFRIFILGSILGFFGAGSLLYLLPVVDQYRVPSHVMVQTNGGNSETFTVILPGDRIMSGRQGSSAQVPEGLQWPELPELSGFEAELFKLRDSEDTVVGIGSRMAVSRVPGDQFVQWVIHLPARGTLFVAMQAQPAEGAARAGILAAGTREFAALRGSVSEEFVRPDPGQDDAEGRINLRTALIGQSDESP
jgi:hypothetical protein